MSLEKRAYPSNRFALELDKQMAGWITSAEGGQATTEPVKSRLAGGYGSRQHPGVTKFEDITISCGTGMSEQFYQWLQSSLNYDHTYHDGAIVAADFDTRERNRLNFYRGLITEFGLPALDAKKNELCHLTAKITPERTEMEYRAEAGNKILSAASIDPRVQKMWVCSGFRLDIKGMPCSNVLTVDALTFKQQTVENPAGETAYPDKHPVHINAPDLVITIPESDAKPWYQWHRDFVVNGKSGRDSELSGSLEFQTANRQHTLFTVHFPILGITKFAPEKLESGSDKIRTVKITMYTEMIVNGDKSVFEYGSTGKGKATWT